MNPLEQGDTFDERTIRWVLDDDALDETLDDIASADEIVIDLETTGLDEHNGYRGYPPRIAMAALTLPFADRGPDPLNIVVPGSHPEGPWPHDWVRRMTLLAEAMRDAPGYLVNQNLKFDLRWLYRFTGVDLSARIAWDTRVSAHLLDENQSTSLKEVVPRTFGIERWDDHDLSTPGAAERVPYFDLGVYAARDTYWTWRLAEAHRFLMGVGRWGDEPPVTTEDRENYRLGRHAVWCAMPMTSTLTEVEQRGMRLDVDLVEEEIETVGNEASEHYDTLVSMYDIDHAGEPSFEPNARWFKAWTDAAVEAGDLRVTALTPSGEASWAKGVLKKQARDGSPAASTLLAWRSATKQVQFYRSWLEHVGPDGRIHADYNVARVVTGRLSSSNPNLQQVSKRLRKVFLPSEGYSLVEVDYSQIEVRLIAFIAQCEPLLDVYREGRDVYVEQAAAIAGCLPEDVTGEQRQRAKAVVLGFMYGMGEDGFQTYADETFDVIYSDTEAIAARQAYFDRWKGMAAFHSSQVQRAVRDGQVVSPLGRVRRLPGIHDANPKVAGHAERQAINSPVQSMASDVMQIAFADVLGYLPGSSRVPGVRGIGTVHDSNVLEVPRGDEVRTTARIMHRMQNVTEILRDRFGIDLPIPLSVEAEIGDRWGVPRKVIAG